MKLPFPHKASKAKVFEATITPDQAAYILEQLMPVNRPVRDSVVHTYAADMKRGAWELTTEAIGFDVNGHLIDGQHRLWACIEAKTNMTTHVAVGLKPEAREVINMGLKRTISDIALFRTGQKLEVLVGATARFMMGEASKVSSAGAVLNFISQHQKLFDLAFSNTSRVKGITHSMMFSVIVRALHSRDQDKVLRFRDVLISGIPEGPGEHQIITLRNFMINAGSPHRSSTLGKSLYLKIERSLEKFLNNETVTKLIEATEELYPIPGDRKRSKVAA